MKTTLVLAIAALTGCSAFTTPKDPGTSIRQDAPAEWADTPNPLDTPETFTSKPEAEGRFGHEWLYR